MPAGLKAHLQSRYFVDIFQWQLFFTCKNFVKTYRIKIVQFIEYYRTISRSRPAVPMVSMIASKIGRKTYSLLATRSNLVIIIIIVVVVVVVVVVFLLFSMFIILHSHHNTSLHQHNQFLDQLRNLRISDVLHAIYQRMKSPLSFD